MEKSVDDMAVDFVGIACFSDGSMSREGGIASAEAVATGDWDVDRSSSTDADGIGEQLTFFVAGSSTESQTVDCISFDYVTFRIDEVNFRVIYSFLYTFVITDQN